MKSQYTGLGCLVLLCTWFVTAAYAQSASEFSAQQLQRQQQREQVQNQQAEEQRPDVRLPRAPAYTAASYPDKEQPCFPIRDIEFTGPDAATFAWALKAADDAKGRCLGAGGVNAVLGRVQNALIEAGFVTTRVLAASQDLLGGTLRLTIVAGRVRAVRFAAFSDEPGPAWRNAFPARPGDILNLRDIEQALENLKRVPTAEANIDIEPGKQPGESDVVIKWKQAFPIRLTLTADDSGSKATGRYQGGATVSADNLLGWHELIYISANRELGDGGARPEHGTRNYAVHYSMPAGYWLLSFNASRYSYFQTIAGAFQNYVYSGTSRNVDAKVARVIYRDGVRKTTAALRLFQRSGNNFIDDTEIEVQRRRMGGFELSLAHKEFIGDSTLDLSLAYKRGNRLFGTLPAPEEEFGEGSSRPAIVNADVSLNLPLSVNGLKLTYQGDWRRQWSPSPLLFQDRFVIGGRYTVRGFDGESSLSADNGWLLRNELAWAVNELHQVYLALDYAKVSGEHLPLAGTALGGGALGWRGRLGRAYLDIFVGQPIYKPETFHTAHRTGGFSLNYQF